MATFNTKDRIFETSTTVGVGAYALAGAQAGFQPFSVWGVGNYGEYFATDDVNWEVGIGTWTNGPSQLARTTILASSNGGAAVNWGGGTVKIRSGLAASRGSPRVLSKSVAGNTDVTLTPDEQRRDVIVLTGALTGNINVLVDATPWKWLVKNGTSGAFNLTFKVTGQTGIGITQGKSRVLYCDGVDVQDGHTDLVSSVAPAPVRQSIRSAALSAGFNALLSAGAALNFNVSATATPAILDFAAGSVDYTATLTADAANQGSLAASNTNYVSADYSTISSVTWGSYLVPPQYGYTFDQTQNALLNFEGTNGATSTTDDFGNTWTLTGCTISTAQFKFGSSSLRIGANTNHCSSSSITSFGDGSWELACWIRPDTGNTGAVQTFAIFTNAGGFGVQLLIDATGHIQVVLSSNGTSQDISAGTSGATVLANATWYRVRLVFDALAGTYRVYLSNNGAAETQEVSISSTARICGISQANIGFTGTNSMIGYIDAFRLIRCATVTGTQTPSASAPAIGDYPVNFFSIPKMQMLEATGASAAAGTDPTFTARNRLFVGEQDTNGATVTATRNYALRGQCTSAWVSPVPASATFTSVNHNIGTKEISAKLELRCVTNDQGYLAGEVVEGVGMSSGGAFAMPAVIQKARNSAGFNTGSGGFSLVGRTGGAFTGFGSLSFWAYRIVAQRNF